jgi:hypothetical protein
MGIRERSFTGRLVQNEKYKPQTSRSREFSHSSFSCSRKEHSDTIGEPIILKVFRSKNQSRLHKINAVPPPPIVSVVSCLCFRRCPPPPAAAVATPLSLSMMRRDQSMTIIGMAVLAHAKAVSRSPLFYATGKIPVGAFVCGVAECNRRGQTTMRRSRTVPRRGRGERHDSASDVNDARSHGPTRRADVLVSSRER